AVLHQREKMLRFIASAIRNGVYFHDYGGAACHHGFCAAMTLDDVRETLTRLDAAVREMAGWAGKTLHHQKHEKHERRTKAEQRRRRSLLLLSLSSFVSFVSFVVRTLDWKPAAVFGENAPGGTGSGLTRDAERHGNDAHGCGLAGADARRPGGDGGARHGG